MVFISDLTNADSLPVLTTSVSFIARRQELIAGNVANLSTPTYRPMDVSIGGFQEKLADAIAGRREAWGGQRGDLVARDSREVEHRDDGTVMLKPSEMGRNVLFHDRNDRDLERTMQDLSENLAAFRVATDLLRTRMDLLNSAIRERA